MARATEGQPGPSDCPRNRLFCPPNCQRCYRGFTPLNLPAILELCQQFRRPTLSEDTQEFIKALPCNQSNTPRQAPAGLLQPLPIPHHPWFHISVDFITGLPTSQGFIVFLTIIDRVSKMAHLVALPKLPSAKETATVGSAPCSPPAWSSRRCGVKSGTPVYVNILEGVLQAVGVCHQSVFLFSPTS